MKTTLAAITAGIVGGLLTVAPAFAIDIPEPATMTLFGVGAAAAVIIARHRRRK